MKIELRLFPDSFAELNKITAAIEASGVELCPPIQGMAVSSFAPAERNLQAEHYAAVSAEMELVEGTLDDLPTFDMLTVSKSRDSAKRLWCEEINTKKEETKADMTFKRKPKVDDAYYDHVISLLDNEAAEHEMELAGEKLTTASDEECKLHESNMAVLQTETSAPEPTPREIVAYMYQGTRYEPSQLAHWTPEQIAELAEPVYADVAPAPAPAPTTVAPAPTTVAPAPTTVAPAPTGETPNAIVMRLIQKHGLAPQLKPLIDLATDKLGLGQPLTDEKRDKLVRALQTVEANAEAFKAGTLTAEQAYGA